MSFDYTTPEWSPLVISAAVTPDHVTVGQTVLLRAVVIDTQHVEQQETHYSGEFKSGEV